LLIVGALLPSSSLGDAPIFLRMTPAAMNPRAPSGETIAFYSFFLVLGYVAWLIRAALFGLSIPVVQVAGGAVVCALAGNSWPTSPNRPM